MGCFAKNLSNHVYTRVDFPFHNLGLLRCRLLQSNKIHVKDNNLYKKNTIIIIITVIIAIMKMITIKTNYSVRLEILCFISRM